MKSEIDLSKMARFSLFFVLAAFVSVRLSSPEKIR